MIIEDQDCLKIVESFDKTGFNYTLSLVNGKYKLTILYAIYRHKIIRFNSLQKYLKKENPLYQYYIKCASGAKNI